MIKLTRIEYTSAPALPPSSPQLSDDGTVTATSFEYLGMWVCMPLHIYIYMSNDYVHIDTLSVHAIYPTPPPNIHSRCMLQTVHAVYVVLSNPHFKALGLCP